MLQASLGTCFKDRLGAGLTGGKVDIHDLPYSQRVRGRVGKSGGHGMDADLIGGGSSGGNNDLGAVVMHVEV